MGLTSDRPMVFHAMKKLVFLLPAIVLFPRSPAAGSDAIEPYVEQGKSGKLTYAVFNEDWLRPEGGGNVKGGTKRVAITGVIPETTGEITIPSAIHGHEVYGIDETALASSPGITAIRIPKTVRFLRPGTLGRARGLEAIHIDDEHPDFKSVDGVMFDKSLDTLLAFPAGRRGEYRVPDGTSTIGPSAFAGCLLLTGVAIPGSVTDIGGHTGGVFEGSENLRWVEIPDSVANIGQKSFRGCVRLERLAIPARVTEITFGLCWGCRQLAGVDLPDGIKSIGNYAFAGCDKLTLARLPAALTTVGSRAFAGCKGLKGLKVPASVTEIAPFAFADTGVELPDPPEGENGG